jgi:hypothetical protein
VVSREGYRGAKYCQECLNKLPPRHSDEIPYCYVYSDGFHEWLEDSDVETDQYMKIIPGPKRPNVYCGCAACIVLEHEHCTGPLRRDYKFPSQ